MNEKVKTVIERLEGMDKQGASYDHKGRHGWRNPIRADTGGILRALVLAKRPYSVLEIGTAYGLSGCYIASALSQGASMVSVEWDTEVAREAQANFDEAELPVHVLSGEALATIDMLAQPDIKQLYDLVFLDANKDGYFEQVQRLIINGMLTNNCLILADNVIDRASEMADFLAFAEEQDSELINTECGLYVIRLGNSQKNSRFDRVTAEVGA